MKKFLLILIISVKIYSNSIEILTFNYPPLQGTSKISKIGLIPEVIKAAFEENNVKVIFKELPAQRAIEQVKKGSSLGIVAVYENFDKDSYKSLVFFPVLHMDFIFFYNKTLLKKFDYKKDEDLKKYTIGVILNGSTHNYAKSKGLNVEGVINLEALFKKVDIGRNQLGISEYLSGLNTISTLFPNERDNWIPYREKSFLSTKGGVVFSKNYKDYKVYEPLFRDGLIKIVKNGKWDQIVKKYYPDKKIDKRSIEIMNNFVKENQ